MTVRIDKPVDNVSVIYGDQAHSYGPLWYGVKGVVSGMRQFFWLVVIR